MPAAVDGATRDGLRGKDELHVVEVVAFLLRICRERRATLDEALQQRWLQGLSYGPYLEQAAQIVGDPQVVLDEEYLDDAQLGAIADLLDSAPSEHELALRARDLATVLDDRRGKHFFSWFSGRVVTAAPGDPFPVPPVEVAAEEMGTTKGLPPLADTIDVPRPMSCPLDGTARLRLVPTDIGRFTLRFDARHHGVVDALFSGTRIAVPGPEVTWAAAIPSCTIFDDLTYDLVDDASTPAFYAVRPKASAAADYRARVFAVLDRAAAEGATIITLPELSIDDELEAEVVRWFSLHDKVALVLAGSRHLTGGERRNRARLLMRGIPPGECLFHDKFSAFSIPIDGVPRDEWIERPNTITVVAGRRWSFSPLICKDFMEPVPRRILADVRVRAVLVASMSPKTDLYVTSAGALAQESQCLVFVSNAPHDATDDVAILAQPRRALPRRTKEKQHSGIVAIISTAGDDFRVVPVT